MPRQSMAPAPRLILVLASAGAVGLPPTAIGQATTPASPTAETDQSDAEAVLRNVAGAEIGVVRFSQNDSTVVVKTKVRGLAEGFHGFHIHAVGICESSFISAGGHYNPTGRTHGSHAGDMPPLVAGPEGTADTHFKTDRFSIADVINRAIIIHQAPDNLAHIPSRYHSHATDVFGPDSATLATGDAGDRVACGVIQRSSGN